MIHIKETFYRVMTAKDQQISQWSSSLEEISNLADCTYHRDRPLRIEEAEFNIMVIPTILYTNDLED